jgi:hypothetical protein
MRMRGDVNISTRNIGIIAMICFALTVCISSILQIAEGKMLPLLHSAYELRVAAWHQDVRKIMELPDDKRKELWPNIQLRLADLSVDGTKIELRMLKRVIPKEAYDKTRQIYDKDSIPKK